MKFFHFLRNIVSSSPSNKLKQLFFKQSGVALKHIAIIPDGNRRWAKSFGQLPLFGHEKGVDTFFDTVTRAKERGIRVLTFYTFSTENWRRSPAEVRGLMRLLKDKLIEKIPEMLNKGIRLKTIGDLSYLPLEVQEAVTSAREQTSICSDIDLVLAINYGGRNEIVRACQKVAREIAKGRLLPDELTEERFSTFLDTKDLPDPDLIIRTGGEKRISNFLTWQSSYSELFYLEKKWPEFIPDDLDDAIAYFQERQRRLGK